ncbi:hypothetical protein N6H14_33710 [Paenibacillus sp. CC-CFT747]|nr:hypothetical protein N6H14_33710 [Paenibacillus sp. CC-CFT747]
MSTPRISVVCDDSRLTQQITQQLHFLNVPIGEIIDKPREAYMQINLKEPRILLIAEPSEAVNISQVIQSVRKVNETAPIIYLSKNAEFISSGNCTGPGLWMSCSFRKRWSSWRKRWRGRTFSIRRMSKGRSCFSRKGSKAPAR